MAKQVSPLGYLYRWRVGVGLEAAFQDSPTSFSALNVPGLAWAMETPGEIEAMIAARDKAATEADK